MVGQAEAATDVDEPDFVAQARAEFYGAAIEDLSIPSPTDATPTFDRMRRDNKQVWETAQLATNDR